MLIIKQKAQAETRVKNSRFLAEVFPVDSQESAREAWRFRKETYDNGGHIVYAFAVGSGQNILGCSDDGEPSGTAGRPVLAVLKGSMLTNAMITVARYFGGTKLGTGGLVHAYSEAAKAALNNAVLTELIPLTRLELRLPYPLYNPLRSKLDTLGFAVRQEEFAAMITICGTIKSELAPEIFHAAAEIGNGKIICRELQQS